MAMNIKDPEAERLATELAEHLGESKTTAVRQALLERRNRVVPEVETAEERYERLHRFLEDEIWSQLPQEELGKPITKEEQEEILGFGPDGV